jgi:hypothetical protein
MSAQTMPRGVRTIALAVSLALLACLLALGWRGGVSVAYAGACLWTGTTSTTWDDYHNWGLGCTGPNGVPSSIDWVGIYVSASMDPVISGDVTVRDINLDPGRV